MEETVQVENAPTVPVEPPKTWLTSQLTALNTHGIKVAVNALHLMKVEETPMLWTITQTIRSMSDFSKLIRLTGLDATVNMLHVTSTKTLNAHGTFMEDGEIHSTHGVLILLAVADIYLHQHFLNYNKFRLYLAFKYFIKHIYLKRYSYKVLKIF